MTSLIFAPVSAPIDLIQDQTRPGRKAKTISVELDRPLLVRGDALGNIVSAGMMAGLFVLIAPLVYFGTALFMNFYLMSHLHEAVLT